jgi:hypothetical protein
MKEIDKQYYFEYGGEGIYLFPLTNGKRAEVCIICRRTIITSNR